MACDSGWPMEALCSPGLSDWFSGGHMTQARDEAQFHGLSESTEKGSTSSSDLKLVGGEPGISRGC